MLLVRTECDRELHRRFDLGYGYRRSGRRRDVLG
jgi:hypothetical protein